MKRGFGSDNHSGVHPEILKSLIDCNQGHAPSYGTDEVSERAQRKFSELFKTPLRTYFVFNGTGANCIGLRALINPAEAVLCSDVSHLNLDECAAPEFFTGGKLVPLPSVNGKLDLQTLKDALIRKGDQHFAQIKAISLTQPTELGTCYTLAELKAITEWAHSQKLLVHIDGARLTNAVTFLQTSFSAMITELKIDAVSFGGTKNGLMMGEALLILNPLLFERMNALRKQSGQLPSKTRFIAAQFEAYLSNNLFQKISEHSLKMANVLRQKLQDFKQISITQPTESNAVFVKIPKSWVQSLKDIAFFYVWDEKTFECRLMTSWDTQEDEIKAFAEKLQNLTTAESK